MIQMNRLNIAVVGITVLTWGSIAFGAAHEARRGQSKSERHAAPIHPAGVRTDIDGAVTQSPLRLAKIRLDFPLPSETEKVAILTFQMSNGSSSTMTDIVFEVSIVEELGQERRLTPARVLAGPFAIQGKIVLEPGHTADCEVLLPNVTPECKCEANVRVLSFRLLENSGS